MKRMYQKTAVLLGVLFSFNACSLWSDYGEGELSINFSEDFKHQYQLYLANDDYDENSDTKASADAVPDPDDFILVVTDSKGELVYSGKFSASPETMQVSAGTYNVKIVSQEFSVPAFSKPQYGDEQSVKVPSGGKADVKLNCTQTNCGIKMKIDQSFLTEYPGACLFVKSAEGKLLYSYSEKRIAYFNPGNVSVMMSEGGTDRILLTRNLKRQEILSLNISAAPKASSQNSGADINVAVDTSRNWTNDSYIIGGGSSGGSDSGNGGGADNGEPNDAYTVTEAKEHIGKTEVWVEGYIVGGDLTSSSNGISFKTPFSSATNIAIAARSSVSSKSSCMSVQLASGEVRDMLNLRDNPSNLGKKVYIKADIVESYYGLPGLKNIKKAVLK